MAGQTNGHNANRQHTPTAVGRPQLSQFADRASQPLTVVEAGHDDQLGVDFNVARRQPAQLLHHVRRGGVAQELPPQLGVADVDGDVERRQAHQLNAPPIVVAQVGQRDEVAEEEGVAVVVVLDVERASELGGHLQDEAERAQVVAAANVHVEGRVGKHQPQRLVVVALRLEQQILAVAAHQ